MIFLGYTTTTGQPMNKTEIKKLALIMFNNYKHNIYNYKIPYSFGEDMQYDLSNYCLTTYKGFNRYISLFLKNNNIFINDAKQ